MLAFGIDVGISGGIAVISDRFGVEAVTMPILKGTPSDVPGKRGSPSQLDGHAIRAWIYNTVARLEAGPNNKEVADVLGSCVVAIEAQQAMPKQGVVSTFHLGVSYGLLRGLVVAMGIPLLLPRPKLWKKVVLPDTPMDKTAAIAYVKNKYPTVDMNVGKRKEILHDGMADAVCIADYAFRELSAGRLGMAV